MNINVIKQIKIEIKQLMKEIVDNVRPLINAEKRGQLMLRCQRLMEAFTEGLIFTAAHLNKWLDEEKCLSLIIALKESAAELSQKLLPDG